MDVVDVTNDVHDVEPQDKEPEPDVKEDVKERVKDVVVDEVVDVVEPRRPRGRQAGTKMPPVKVETVYQEQRVLDELERIRQQIDTLKQSELRANTDENIQQQEPAEDSPPKLTPCEMRVNRLRERKKSYADLWTGMHA
jgi:polyribonucleotide nucleotidyltransferase